MHAAYIRGAGLSCALGMNVRDCAADLRHAHAEPQRLTLDGFAEPLRVRYYRIPDAAPLFDSARIPTLIAGVAQAAIAEARLTRAELRSLPVFVGSSCFSISASETRYAETLARDPETAIPMPLCGYQDIAATAQRALGLGGDTYTFNTACTASANALLAAQHMLALGRYRHALVIGAEFANRTTLTGFYGLQLLAESAQPFDANRRGLVLGEGVGAVLLAAEAGAANEVRLLAGANNCDGWSVSTANPDGKSVAAVLQSALQHAQLQTGQVRGIKAHGTATASGDSAEAHGLRQVFNPMPPVSVLKPCIGHTLGACGVNELVLYAQALQRGELPATPGFDTPDPELGLQPLQAAASAPPGYYLLNHFGFGGNNTVLVLEKPGS